EAEKYLADSSADKFEKLADHLLESGDHADYFTNKWSAVLRNRRKSDKDDIQPTQAFHAWIRDSIHKNKPFDQFVREVVTATGEEINAPPNQCYHDVRYAASQVDDMAQ